MLRFEINVGKRGLYGGNGVYSTSKYA
jgi:hypothetical protein